jgi:hypothetical protein
MAPPIVRNSGNCLKGFHTRPVSSHHYRADGLPPHDKRANCRYTVSYSLDLVMLGRVLPSLGLVHADLYFYNMNGRETAAPAEEDVPLQELTVRAALGRCGPSPGV